MGFICELGADMDVIKNKIQYENTKEIYIRCSTSFILGGKSLLFLVFGHFHSQDSILQSR